MSESDRQSESAPDPQVPDGAAGGADTSDQAEPTIEALTGRIAELEDLRLRAVADLDNFRKRCAAQVQNAGAESARRVAAHWLPVVDNLERALVHAEADPSSIVDGVRAVRDQAVNVLAQLGYPRRDDLGATFDPARHEAIATRSDPDAAEGSIVEVVAPAYGEDGRQLRAAQVVVAKAD